MHDKLYQVEEENKNKDTLDLFLTQKLYSCDTINIQNKVIIKELKNDNTILIKDNKKLLDSNIFLKNINYCLVIGLIAETIIIIIK